MYIYILHADSPLMHAQHYSGSTKKLSERIKTHASGNGAKLTREFQDRNFRFRLGALGQTSDTAGRRVERLLKDSKNVPQFCEICQGANAKRIPETLPISLDLVPFSTDSQVIKGESTPPITITDRPSKRELEWIREAMKTKKAELGWLGEKAIADYAKKQQVVIAASLSGNHAYLIYSISQDKATVKVQQCFTEDGVRFQYIGASIVNYIAAKHPNSAITCHVREDLPANHFWTSINFTQLRKRHHKTSGKNLIQYHRPSFVHTLIQDQTNDVRS